MTPSALLMIILSALVLAGWTTAYVSLCETEKQRREKAEKNQPRRL